MPKVLWGQTVDKHHTGVRQVKLADSSSKGGILDQHYIGVGQVEVARQSSIGTHKEATKCSPRNQSCCVIFH